MLTKPVDIRENLKWKAAHARQLAKGIAGDEAEKRLIEYAKELEIRADDLTAENEGNKGSS